MSSFRGDRLKQLRKNKGLRQEDVAIQLGLNRVSYSHYESNTNKPPSDKLSMLVDIFNTNADYLLGISDDPSPGTRQVSFNLFTGETELLSERDTKFRYELENKLRTKHSLKDLIESVENDESKSILEKKGILQNLEESIEKLDLEVDALKKENQQFPNWATPKDKRDLKRIIEEDAPLMFDGVPIEGENKQRIIDVLTGLFWEAKAMNKKTYSRKKNKDKTDDE